MPNERTKEKAHKMPCIMCSRKTLGRYKISEKERVPACGECMQMLDFGLRLSMRQSEDER